MKAYNIRLSMIALSSALLVGAVIQHAQAAPVGIASGQTSGTNWPMVEDIKIACSTTVSPISNNISNGSIDNIGMVYNDRATQYGVSQEDALVYQKGVDPKMMDNIVMVFPFFSTEMHLVVRADSSIRSLADLQGKRVNEGPDGSGTWVTTQVIKGLTGLKFAAGPHTLLGQKDGLAAVQSGAADAMFVVAGMPVTMLQTARNVRLVPLSHPALDGFKYYTRTTIPSAGVYNAGVMGGQSVPTYKVRNGLITYNYRNQYQAEISALVTCITRKLPELQAGTGGSGKDGAAHPKWRDVNPLDIDQIAWPVHPTAAKAIKAVATTKK